MTRHSMLIISSKRQYHIEDKRRLWHALAPMHINYTGAGAWWIYSSR